MVRVWIKIEIVNGEEEVELIGFSDLLEVEGWVNF